MVLVDRQWGWTTNLHTNSWAGHFTALTSGSPESSFSEHLASQAVNAQAHTSTSTSTSTSIIATVPGTTTASTTDSPTQSQTTAPPAALAAQTTVTSKAVITTSESPTPIPLSFASASETTPTTTTTSPSRSDRARTHSSVRYTSCSISTPSSLSGGLTVSLPDPDTVSGSGAAVRPTAPSSSSESSPGSIVRPIVTTSSSTAYPDPNSSSPNDTTPHRISKGEIAAIVLGVVFALGLCGLGYYLWRRRKGRRRDSTFIQYPFSSDAAATSPMCQVPPRGLAAPNTPAQWSDRVTSPAATLTAFGSPAGASGYAYGYGGGLAPYPLGDKSSSLYQNDFYP